MGFGATLTSGIQDIAAFLPIFGTDQCETHVGSALDRGYLYAAAAPMSLFGCLGIVKAAIAVLFASISSLFSGAQKLNDAGFELVGSVAPMIGTSQDHSFEFETTNRISTCLTQFDVPVGDRSNQLRIRTNYTAVELECFRWNISLTVWTIILAAVGLIPYVSIINTQHGAVKSWIYPILRVMGSAICTICIQFLLQRRIVAIIHDDANLSRNNHQEFYILFALRVVLILGSGATAVGYVGCFNLLQDTSTRQTVLWLVLEAILCVLRVFLWSLNPESDEGIWLKFTLTTPVRQITQASISAQYEDILPSSDVGSSFTGIPATQFIQMTQPRQSSHNQYSRQALPFYLTAVLSTSIDSLYFLCTYKPVPTTHLIHAAQSVSRYGLSQTVVALYKYKVLQPIGWYVANYSNRIGERSLAVTLRYETSMPTNNLLPRTETGRIWTVDEMNAIVAQAMIHFNDPTQKTRILLVSLNGRIQGYGPMKEEILG